jgi:carbamoyltransferase
LRDETGRSHLGLAGGIFLNCALNGRLLRESGFESVFVFPAAGDAGAAAGAAAEVAGLARRPLEHAFLGDRFAAPADIGEPVEDPAEVAAQALADGKIVGWFSGAMEFGPRALGARSILADPRIRDISNRLNRTVKFREDFRPFAPAVLEEEAANWFVDARPSPFMLLTFQAKPGVREKVPGIVHVDGSARVQTVPADGPLRGVVEGFFKRTGVPMVLNTSFNVRGEPIVRTPGEAIAVFERGAMDLLVLEDRVVAKK